MPLYEYRCDNCNNIIEVKESIKNYKKLSQCPNCNSTQIHRIFTPPHVFVYLSDNQVNLGHLANRHRDRWSDDKKQHIENVNKKRIYGKQGRVSFEKDPITGRYKKVKE